MRHRKMATSGGDDGGWAIEVSSSIINRYLILYLYLLYSSLMSVVSQYPAKGASGVVARASGRA